MAKSRSVIKIHVNVGKTELQKKLLAITSDRHSKEEVHKELGKYLNNFVPMASGDLRMSMRYTATYVIWDTPYARYQYDGVVWAPNIPLTSGGRIYGWRSRKPKHPTGRELGVPGYWKGWKFGYTTPGTMHHWDRALTANGMRAYTNRVTNVLKRRARRLNKTW